MPTARARTFLIAAIVLYLFANQTQVGWLYVMSAVLAGAMLTGAWLSRGMLRGITGERRTGLADELYEGDPLEIELEIGKVERPDSAHVRVTEICPLAEPDSAEHQTEIFIPSLPFQQAVRFSYRVTIDRRGLHEFPPLKLRSSAPFGFIQQRRDLVVPTRVLVYPEVRELDGLELLDRRIAPQLPRPRSGVGYEVIGVRPYRSGDSPRHIHWYSVARTGQLISKEFADEAQPGLSLVLDLYQHPYSETESKHTPFEWAVKCAASIGDYAQRRGYPLHLVADDETLAVPRGPVTRWALLQYLARVQPEGERTLPQVMGELQTFVAVILPWPDRSLVPLLVDLHARRVEVMAVVLDPASFPAGGLSGAPLVDELRMVGIEAYLVKYGESWVSQLQSREASWQH